MLRLYQCPIRGGAAPFQHFVVQWKRNFAADKNIKVITKCDYLPKLSQIDPYTLDETVAQPKVVIVGAGMAGLSAAQKLADCGLRNVVVLEALERPGGRIHSCFMGDVIGELGAQWIKGGTNANPVFNLATTEGLLKAPLQTRPATSLCLTSDGRAIDAEVASAAVTIYKKIETQAFSLFSIDTQKKHGTLKKFFLQRMKEELATMPSVLCYDLLRVLYGLFNGIKVRWGDDPEAMSADEYGSFIKIPGDPVRVPLGFVGVLGPLLSSIPKGTIQYGEEVRCIKWDTQTPRALVRTVKGEHPADYVIVTASLGVLKAKLNDLFQPSLPEDKIEAIQSLGYGHIEKIILEYSRPFWAEGEGSMVLAWSGEELEKAVGGWSTGVSVIEELPGSRNMLMTSIGGPQAEQTIECSEAQIVEQMTHIIRSFTGDSSLPYPINIVRSKWGCNDMFRGAGSYLSVKSNVEHQCILGSPASDPCNPLDPPILLFAGEATSPGHHSTVQGARLSGLREAERILKLTKKLRGPPASAQ